MSHKMVAVNTITQMAGKAVSIALAVFTIGMMARYLGPERFGWYSTTITYLQFFGIFVDFGLTIITTQMTAEKDADEPRIIGNLTGLRIVSAIIFLGLAPVIMIFLPYPAAIKTATLVTSFSFLFILIGQVMAGILQRHLAMWWATLAENLNRVVLLACIFIIIFTDAGFVYTMAALSLASFAQLVVLILTAAKYVRLSVRFEWVIWKEIIKRSGPIAISTIFNLIYLRGDILIMSFTRTQEEVGLYGAAFRVIDVFNTIPFLFMGVVLPLLTIAWTNKNKEEFNGYLQLSFDSLAFMSFPIAAGGLIISTHIMTLLGGAAFAPAGYLLKILLIAIVGVYLGTTFSYAIVAINEQKKTIWVYGVNALIAIVGYLIFIPLYGGTAAAIVTVVNELLVPILIFIICWRVVRFKISFGKVGKIFIASTVMAIVVWPVRDFALWVPLLTGAVVYLGASFVLGIIKPKEIAALMQIKS